MSTLKRFVSYACIAFFWLTASTASALGVGGGIAGTTPTWAVPRYMPGLEVWLRPDMGTTVATGVSVWADQSGHGNNVVQATGAAQPILTAGAFGSYPGLTCSSVQFLEQASSTVLNGSTGLTVFTTVIRGAGFGASPIALTTQMSERIQQNNVGDVCVFSGAAGTAVNACTAGAVVPTTTTIISATVDLTLVSNKAQTYVNGTQNVLTRADGAGASLATADMFIGARSASAGPLGGVLGEVILINQALTAAQLTRLSRYTGIEYGVSVP